MAKENPKLKHRRNDSLIDWWSLVHFASSALIALLLGPLPAFVITLAWEPFEIGVLSPLLARLGVLFGHESLRNSLSDILFNSLGIAAAVLLA